jgi:hypothetical protein
MVANGDKAPEAGAPADEIEITPAMIEAGVAIISDDWGVLGRGSAEELAELVFRAMAFVQSRHDCMDSKP